MQTFDGHRTPRRASFIAPGSTGGDEARPTLSSGLPKLDAANERLAKAARAGSDDVHPSLPSAPRPASDVIDTLPPFPSLDELPVAANDQDTTPVALHNRALNVTLDEYTHHAGEPITDAPGTCIDIDGAMYIYQPHEGGQGQAFEVIEPISGVGSDLGYRLSEYDYIAHPDEVYCDRCEGWYPKGGAHDLWANKIDHDSIMNKEDETGGFFHEINAQLDDDAPPVAATAEPGVYAHLAKNLRRIELARTIDHPRYEFGIETKHKGHDFYYEFTDRGSQIRATRSIYNERAHEYQDKQSLGIVLSRPDGLERIDATEALRVAVEFIIEREASE